jgi:D-aspartate ligase
MAKVAMPGARTRKGRGTLADGPYGAGAVVIGGDYVGLGIVRSLGRHGVPVVVLDDELSIAGASRFSTRAVRVKNLRDEQSTLDALAALRHRYGLEGWLLYPTRDEIVAALARNMPDLSRYFRVPLSGWEAIRHAWDKRETYRLAERLGVGFPRTWFPLDEAGLDQVDAGGPVIIKPAIKEHFFYATKAKAWRADTRGDLRRLFRRAASIVGDGEVIIQELIPGGGEQQYSYCALFKDGAALASMTVRRRRQHPSDFGRASTFVETVQGPPLEAPSVRYLRELGYYGLVELEYKRDPRDGACKLLDFNARTWGYHTLGRIAGADFPYLLFRDQMGDEVGQVRARDGMRWIRLTTDVPNALRDIRAGRLRAGAYVGSLRGIDTEAVFTVRDPLPGMYEIALLPYLAVKRGL